MRVIGGTARGTTLFSPEGESTRPTIDRIKETIFNILRPNLFNSVFLDLYSGSGSIGIEALSCGSREAHFVENSKYASDLIKANLEKTKFTPKAKIHNEDVINFLENTNDSFDIIFFDPPYADHPISKILNIIETRNLLNEDGIIISEQASETPIHETPKIKKYKIKEYKKTNVVFYTLD